MTSTSRSATKPSQVRDALKDGTAVCDGDVASHAPHLSISDRQAWLPLTSGELNASMTRCKAAQAPMCYVWSYVLDVPGCRSISTKLVSVFLPLIIQRTDTSRNAQLFSWIWHRRTVLSNSNLSRLAMPQFSMRMQGHLVVHVHKPVKRVPRRLKQRGVPDPKPLRSTKFPDGLPFLTGVNKERVHLANCVYENICKIFDLLPSNCIISIENPTRSHMWSTSWFRKLIKTKRLFPISFQVCMHGSMRDTWTTFCANCSGFSPLAVVCDDNRTHLPWGVGRKSDGWRFNTAEEAEYPDELCSKIANIISAEAQQNNVVIMPSQPVGKTGNKAAKLRAVQGGRQPRGNFLPQIIPEFSHTLQLQWPTDWPQQAPRMLTSSELQHFSLPFATKLLSFKKGETGTAHTFAEIGVYRTPEQFTHEALYS